MCDKVCLSQSETERKRWTKCSSYNLMNRTVYRDFSKRILPLGTVWHDTWSSSAVLGAFSTTKLTSRPHELQNLGKVSHWKPQKGQYILIWKTKNKLTEDSTVYLYSVVLSFISLLKGPEYIFKYYSYCQSTIYFDLVLTIN